MQTPQKVNVGEYDWNRIAARQILFRVKQCKERQQNTKHQKCYRLRKHIPDSPCSFKIMLKNLLIEGSKDTTKQEILHEVLNESVHESVKSDDGDKRKSEVPVSLLKSHKAQNHVADHEALVEEIKSDCGSLRNVAIITGIHWQRFWELCQPQLQKHVATVRSKIKRKECLNFMRDEMLHTV